jgi:hypothetical protein
MVCDIHPALDTRCLLPMGLETSSPLLPLGMGVIVPFHYNCTLCILYIYQYNLVRGGSHAILYIEYILKGCFPSKWILIH